MRLRPLRSPDYKKTTCAHAALRTHKPDAAARRPDPEIPADPGHHPRGSAPAEQTQNPLSAGADHRRRGDRTPRPQPRAARQQHHPLGYGRTSVHHVPLGTGHGHVRFPPQQLAEPRLRRLHLLRPAGLRHPGRLLHPRLPDLFVDPARRAVRLADAHRLPHRQQTGHRPRQGRHDRRRRHGHHRHAGPAAAHRDRRHGHGQRRRHVLVAARRLRLALHRHHRLPLPAAGPLVLQAGQRQRLAVHFRTGDGLPRGLPRPHGRAGTDHRRVPLGTRAQPPDPPHLAADEPHRVRRQRHLHPLLPDRRGHADRLPRLLPRLGEPRSGGHYDRADHGGEIRRRMVHAEDLPTLARPADRHLRLKLGPCGRDVGRRDGRLQHHPGSHARRRADPPLERERAQRHDPDDSGHLHRVDASPRSAAPTTSPCAAPRTPETGSRGRRTTS